MKLFYFMEFIINEIQGKKIHDQFEHSSTKMQQPPIWVSGPLIIGAGPSGLATAACLKKKGIPSMILERSNCIASLWKHKTYDRLHLHLPKQYCELPFLHFPKNLPTYPTKHHFISYMEEYASRFCLEPVFGETVLSAEFDGLIGFWRVKTSRGREYLSRWIVVATGENAEELVPEIDGMDEFSGTVVHTSCYKSGECFRGKKVLVVGCGNSGMEVCLDLCDHNSQPSLVVRDSVHILPQQMFGTSTFGLSMCLLKWFPMKIVDKFLLIMSRIILGDTARLGLKRPKSGPLELKSISGKTPVLDFGTLAKIRDGEIQVRPEIKRLKYYSVEFVDGREEDFDAVILATGYKSNTPTWLKAEPSLFSNNNGPPGKSFLEGWKGDNGLYAVGFTKRGLLGTSMEARWIAEDLQHQWNSSQNSSVPCNKNEIERRTRNNQGKEPAKH